MISDFAGQTCLSQRSDMACRVTRRLAGYLSHRGGTLYHPQNHKGHQFPDPMMFESVFGLRKTMEKPFTVSTSGMVQTEQSRDSSYCFFWKQLHKPLTLEVKTRVSRSQSIASSAIAQAFVLRFMADYKATWITTGWSQSFDRWIRWWYPNIPTKKLGITLNMWYKLTIQINMMIPYDTYNIIKIASPNNMIICICIYIYHIIW